jgi:hypothetical protein
MGRNLALAVLLAVALSCTGSADTPTSGRDRWFEVASATGSIRAGAPATTECRWDLPCDLVRTDAFETGSGPIRLVCEGESSLWGSRTPITLVTCGFGRAGRQSERVESPRMKARV